MTVTASLKNEVSGVSDNPVKKIVIRRLPPSLTKDQFLDIVSPLPDFDYFYYCNADKSLGLNGFSRAYICFKDHQDVFNFRDRFDNYVFVDSKSNEYPALVEYAPYQRRFKLDAKNPPEKDSKCNTIDQDTDYMKYLEQFDKPTGDQLPSCEAILEELEQKEKDKSMAQSSTAPKVMTPLLEFMRKKREEKKLFKDKERDRDRDMRSNRRRERDRDDDKRYGGGYGGNKRRDDKYYNNYQSSSSQKSSQQKSSSSSKTDQKVDTPNIKILNKPQTPTNSTGSANSSTNVNTNNNSASSGAVSNPTSLVVNKQEVGNKSIDSKSSSGSKSSNTNTSSKDNRQNSASSSSSYKNSSNYGYKNSGNYSSNSGRSGGSGGNTKSRSSNEKNQQQSVKEPTASSQSQDQNSKDEKQQNKDTTESKDKGVKNRDRPSIQIYSPAERAAQRQQKY